jgi:hypothetical protein
MLNVKIKLIRGLMYIWDVVFTFIDTTQLKIYLKMREVNNTLTNSQRPVNKSKISEEDIQEQWKNLVEASCGYEEIMVASKEGPKPRITRGSGRLK